MNHVTRVLESIIFFTVAFCSKWNHVSRSRFTVNGITVMVVSYWFYRYSAGLVIGLGVCPTTQRKDPRQNEIGLETYLIQNTNQPTDPPVTTTSVEY